jgi:hypothetical protein
LSRSRYRTPGPPGLKSALHYTPLTSALAITMTYRTVQVFSVGAFWLMHFAASLFALAMLMVTPLHPEDFSGLELLAAQVLLFPVFNFITDYGSPLFLAALNSTLWSVASYYLVVYLRSTWSGAHPKQGGGDECLTMRPSRRRRNVAPRPGSAVGPKKNEQ